MSTDLVIETRITDGSRAPETVASRTFTYTEQRVYGSILNNAAAVLWDAAASGSLAAFDVLTLVSDQPVELELTIKEGDAAEELVSLTLAKNTALVLGGNAARYNHSASDAFAGTLDVIDKIRAKELNSVAATITLTLYT